MSLELVIFIIVAAIAIFSAAFMLVSRNAVHSALFLVVNFLCVAFFYLMLNAPFLAMIQVTVYAGAIMVLFMFVIMLLGSERLKDDEPKFPWLVPAAVGLTTIFLVLAFVVIAGSQVGNLKPVPPSPEVRFVHAAGGIPALDVYLNNEKVANGIAYREATDFAQVKSGEYNVAVFLSCTASDPAQCPDPVKSGAAPIMAGKVTLDTQNTDATTFIIGGESGKLILVAVPTDLTPVQNDSDVRLTAVNLLPGTTKVSLVKPDPADPNNAQKNEPIISDLNFSDAGKPVTLTAGTYDLYWVSGTSRIYPVSGFSPKAKTSELLILAPEFAAGTQASRPTLIRIDPTRAHETFGSPQQVGQVLFSSFLLPFELVSLLLLAAMVGAIILTREEVPRRIRRRVVVAPLFHHPDVHVPANPHPESSAD